MVRSLRHRIVSVHLLLGLHLACTPKGENVLGDTSGIDGETAADTTGEAMTSGGTTGGGSGPRTTGGSGGSTGGDSDPAGTTGETTGRGGTTVGTTGATGAGTTDGIGTTGASTGGGECYAPGVGEFFGACDQGVGCDPGLICRLTPMIDEEGKCLPRMCEDPEDCRPPSGSCTATPVCSNDMGAMGRCLLDCTDGGTCPAGTTCTEFGAGTFYCL